MERNGEGHEKLLASLDSVCGWTMVLEKLVRKTKSLLAGRDR